MSKEVITLKMEPRLAEYLRENLPNMSGFINEILFTALGEAVVDGEEYKTTNVRARVLRMHLEVLQKEIAELERQRDMLERALDEMDDDAKVLWDIDIDEMYWRDRGGRPKK